MADRDLRKLEREALQGDEQAGDKLLRELLRTKPGTWEGLVADVIARPEEDLPRLLFARWLRIKGQVPRAKLIEYQVTVARDETYYSVLKRMRRELKDLIDRHHDAWVKPLGLGQVRATFERGFAVELKCDANRLLNQGAAVFRREPIERLELRGCDPATIEAVCAAPWIGRVTSLKLRGVGDAGAAVLAQASTLSHLRRLNLGECGIGPTGAQALASSSTLTNLDRLSLSGNGLGDDGVVAIAESPTFSNLTALYLARTDVADDGLRALADSPHLSSLERLGLDGNQEPSDGAWSALAGSPHLPALSWVEVTGWGGPRGDALTALQNRVSHLRRR